MESSDAGTTITSFGAHYEAIHGASPPERVEFGESAAPVFSRASGFLRGFDLTMQIQVGCPGGCLYCYVPSNNYFTSPRTRGKDGSLWGFRVFNKQGVIEQALEALQGGMLADKTIYWSGVTDPYAAPPKVTRAIWESLSGTDPALRPRRVVVQTRFRPDRDAEPMAAYARSSAPADGGPAVVISYSVGTDREDLIAAWEKSTPRFAQRMEGIERLRACGLTVIPTLSPFAYWNDLAGALRRFQSWSIPYITVLFFKQLAPWSRSANTPRKFLDYLRREHPMLLDPAWQSERLDEMKSIYGEGRVLDGQPGFASLTRPQLYFKGH